MGAGLQIHAEGNFRFFFFLFLQSFRKAENVNDAPGLVTVMILPKGERWDGMCVGHPSLGAALLCYSST